MGVYVKGMEMPESCKYCRFYSPLVGFMCIAANKKYGDDFNPFCKKRPDWCPLIEIKPHGRLIDADALKQKKKHSNEFAENVVSVAEIDWMPTIIEAEYPPSITFDEMWESLKKQDPFFVEVEEEVKKLKAEDET